MVEERKKEQAIWRLLVEQENVEGVQKGVRWCVEAEEKKEFTSPHSQNQSASDKRRGEVVLFISPHTRGQEYGLRTRTGKQPLPTFPSRWTITPLHLAPFFKFLLFKKYHNLFNVNLSVLFYCFGLRHEKLS